MIFQTYNRNLKEFLRSPSKTASHVPLYKVGNMEGVISQCETGKQPIGQLVFQSDFLEKPWSLMLQLFPVNIDSRLKDQRYIMHHQFVRRIYAYLNLVAYVTVNGIQIILLNCYLGIDGSVIGNGHAQTNLRFMGNLSVVSSR